jgi:hypothetical protein
MTVFYPTLFSRLSEHAATDHAGRIHVKCVPTTSFPLPECGKARQVRLCGWKRAKIVPAEGHDALHATCRLTGQLPTSRIVTGAVVAELYALQCLSN